MSKTVKTFYSFRQWVEWALAQKGARKNKILLQYMQKVNEVRMYGMIRSVTCSVRYE